MDILDIYFNPIPDFIRAIADTRPLQRLRGVGMNCGCEYTSFPRFRELSPYTRYEHSLGVALIVWRFTSDPAQTLAGLLHDVATPTFAHVVDFVNGDYMKQESTEAGTSSIIENSRELQAVLRDLGLSTSDVADYHMYPIADNDSPRLSADRLEYTIGNALNFGLADFDALSGLFAALTVCTNESGNPELCFADATDALKFSDIALKCSEIYVSDEDRYSMQILSEILRDAADAGVISGSDIRGTESSLISKLKAAPLFDERWTQFHAMSGIARGADASSNPLARRLNAKRRCIDPMVAGQGRVSELFPDFAARLNAFRNKSLDYYIFGLFGEEAN